jgi:predicted ATPase/DNA-binding winged helix-turn-helix (wHTH) protein
MADQSALNRNILSFGRFELSPAERLLTADGARIELGARTLDTLIALASRPNEVLGKRELMAQVWPDVTVEEGSLRFHIAALRRALGDGRDGARYIATLAGRGYCFVAQVTRSAEPPAENAAAASPAAHFLPARLARMVGRAETVRLIAARLHGSRFVTLAGAGGVGKTTVAVAVAHELLAAFEGAVVFVDLGMLRDASAVASSLAAILGLSVQSDDPLPELLTYLRDRRMLIVLDCCEHVIEAAARLAESLFMAAPSVHILATSREALRVEGEFVHRLAPLAVPPDDPGLTAAQALAFSATQLFLERAVANGARAEFDDADAAIVARICRKLDGVALALELAAGRVATYGLAQTASLLDQRLALQWPGARTAPPRQRSLNATLDWSYSLLSETERAVLGCLAVFVGHFTLAAAQAVAGTAAPDPAAFLDSIENLVAKSMLATHPVGARMRYRLLDTTRAYLLGIGADPAARAARHAAFYLSWLEQIATAWPHLSDAGERASLRGDLGNARAALEWCFGPEGDGPLGVRLAVAAAPVFLAMSLLTECRLWSQRALDALDDATSGGRMEMRLQATLGLSMMWTRGNSAAAHAALNRSIAIAEAQGDVISQIQLFAPLHVFRLRSGEFRTALRHANHVRALSHAVEDPAAVSLARMLLGFSRHLAGELADARREFEAALRLQHDPFANEASQPSPGTLTGDAMAAPIVALAASACGSALARTLWLQGHPEQALQRVHQTFADAALVDHPVTLFVALTWAISVLLWNGHLDDAETQIARFAAHAEAYAMRPQIVIGRGFQGELAISRGDTASGIALLESSLHELHALGYEMLTTAFNIALVQGYSAIGNTGSGLELVNETIRLVEANGDLCYMPELLRMKAGLLRRGGPGLEDEAESCLAASLAMSRSQGALAWELRSSIDLAQRLAEQSRSDEAAALLHAVCARFTDGMRTADLVTAAGLLEDFRSKRKEVLF